MIRSGTSPRAAGLQHVLRRQPVDLETRRGCRAQNSTTSWSRNGTRTSSECAIDVAVEVVEHVVDERELRVEIERRRRADRASARSPGARPRASRSPAVASASSPRTSRRRSASSRRPLIASSRSRRSPAASVAPRAGPTRAPGRRARAPAPRSGRGSAAASRATSSARAVLPVAAEQLVGALAGERDRHVLRRELGEREEAERRQVGERLVEMPDELRQVDLPLGERELQLVMIGPEERGHFARVGELVVVGRPPRSRPRTSSPGSTCCAPSARR